jgi:hypothetical protein
MAEAFQRICERATVRLPRKGGQGVLVPGNLIVTAAHCIGWSSEGASMAHEATLPEPIATAAGQALLVSVLAVEPVSDIALLGALDEQGFPEEGDAYEAWCEKTTPVRLYTGNLPPDAAERAPCGIPKRTWARRCPSLLAPAHVLTHNKGWITGRVQQMRPDAYTFWLETEESIDGGTSGGPVLAEDGRLPGVVTWAEGPISRPDGAAPVWAVAKMTEGGPGKRNSRPPGQGTR